MQYKRLGKTELLVSGLGIGTNRFDVNDTKTETGLKKIEDIICHAVLNKGLNYMDIAHTYIGGKAERVLKHIYPKIKDKCFISSKVTYREDRTAEQAYNRIVKSIIETGVEYYDIEYVWHVHSYKEFLEICKSGGIYDGILKAKEDGLVKHIGFSSHATPEDTIKILETGLFEVVIISFNVNNYKQMECVVEKAEELDIGILSMNSLVGGIIPENENYFKGICLDGETLSTAALRFNYEYGIHCVLSSMESIEKIDQNSAAFEEYYCSQERLKERILGFTNRRLENICVGCNYCSGCPRDIPIKELLQAYNARLFVTHERVKNRTDNYLKKSIQIFDSSRFQENLVPDEPINPCIKCGKCERVCTQSLPVMEYIQDIYNRASSGGFAKSQRDKRVKKLLFDKEYKRIGFYPAGQYTKAFIKWLKENYPINFECYVYDSNEMLWNTELLYETSIHSPQNIGIDKIDKIIVCNFAYLEEIYQMLINNEMVVDKKILVEKLHEANEVPWF